MIYQESTKPPVQHGTRTLLIKYASTSIGLFLLLVLPLLPVLIPQSLFNFVFIIYFLKILLLSYGSLSNILFNFTFL